MDNFGGGGRESNGFYRSKRGKAASIDSELEDITAKGAKST
jgi:hypothetical protein